MYRSILIPLDGTVFGERAVPIAAEVARRTGATLHLVHVAAPGSAWTPLEGMMPGSSPGSITAVEDRDYLEGLLAGLRRRTHVEGDVRVLDGPVGRSVAECAVAAEVDLVVMSTHARTGISRVWHRDVAGYLTRHLKVPVLAVPVREKEPAGSVPTTLARLLVPVGEHVQNEEVLDNVAVFCQAMGATPTLLRIVAPPVEVGYTLLAQSGHVNPYRLEDLDREARRELEGAAARLRRHGLEVEVVVEHGANVGEAILAHARDRFDAIAVGTHGLGTVRHLFASSVVEAVVAGAAVPVLLQHVEGMGTELAYEEGIRESLGWRAREAPAVSPPIA